MNKDLLEFVLSFLINECPSLAKILGRENDNYNGWELSVWSEKNGFNFIDVKGLSNPPVHKLDWAASQGYVKICRSILKEYNVNKSTIFDILEEAIYNDNEQICSLAVEFGVKPNWMILCAASYGNENICSLAKKLGATNFRGMMFQGAFKRHERICRLAKEWGSCDYEFMLEAAVQGNHKHLCKLAKEWGAKNFFAMLELASGLEHTELYFLALGWIVTSNNKVYNN